MTTDEKVGSVTSTGSSDALSVQECDKTNEGYFVGSNPTPRIQHPQRTNHDKLLGPNICG